MCIQLCALGGDVCIASFSGDGEVEDSGTVATDLDAAIAPLESFAQLSVVKEDSVAAEEEGNDGNDEDGEDNDELVSMPPTLLALHKLHVRMRKCLCDSFHLFHSHQITQCQIHVKSLAL